MYENSEHAYSQYTQCHTCGKNIYIPVVAMWTYKAHNYKGQHDRVYFCGWNCMRKFEKDRDEHFKALRKKKYGLKD